LDSSIPTWQFFSKTIAFFSCQLFLLALEHLFYSMILLFESINIYE